MHFLSPIHAESSKQSTHTPNSSQKLGHLSTHTLSSQSWQSLQSPSVVHIVIGTIVGSQAPQEGQVTTTCRSTVSHPSGTIMSIQSSVQPSQGLAMQESFGMIH